MAEDRERCLGAGMDGYLVKPIQPTALLDAIERIAAEREPPAAAADRGAVAADGAELLEQVGGDARLLGEIAELFVRESGKHLAALRQAIGSRDAEAFGREIDRKSTRLNSSHMSISYAVFCLKKKKKKKITYKLKKYIGISFVQELPR